MDDVSKIAHNVKTRLEHLQQGNQAALERKASSSAVVLRCEMQTHCAHDNQV